MTRATLLHVLERPTALGPAEVRELEQLAQAFPYCQTAHLLLAKAAHDHGTMLAGQRLRRAATYAADRTLLRRLIEQEEPAIVPEPTAMPAPPHPLDLVDWPDEYVPPAAAPPPGPVRFVAAPAPTEALPLASVSLPPASDTAAEVPTAAETTVLAVAALPPDAFSQPATALPPVPELPLITPSQAMPVDSAAAATAVIAESTDELTTTSAPAILAEDATPEIPEEVTPPASAMPEAPIPAATVEEAPATHLESEPAAVAEAAIAETPVRTTVTMPAAEAEALPTTAPTAAPTTAAPVAEASIAPANEEPEAELPPQAPAIRPPVEVGEARFEFGLADPAPVVAALTYELPGLVDEWAASSVTRSLGSPNAVVPAALAPVVPAFTPAAFTGDAVVGYAFGESSRLGLSMQLLDLLTAKAEAAESATAVVAAAQPPASALPPTGTFFEPDPLLLDHWATHCPAAPELPSTVDLINNFLKRQPRLTRPAMLPPSATHQADLSVRSTRAEPDLVSENLARIFVRQGKTARAIEIYEKLMMKQPEKRGYFAAQIQELQPPTRLE